MKLQKFVSFINSTKEQRNLIIWAEALQNNEKI